MRQCGAFELRIFTRVATPNRFKLTDTWPPVFQSLDTRSQKNYHHVVTLNVRAHLKSQIPY
jgi:hypothetical protein